MARNASCCAWIFSTAWGSGWAAGGGRFWGTGDGEGEIAGWGEGDGDPSSRADQKSMLELRVHIMLDFFPQLRN